MKKSFSFYPGPSQVHSELPEYFKDAYDKGILSINHRSDEFVKLCQKTIHLLKQKLNIPEDYTIMFASSATECWEIAAQSLVENGSFHFYNGAFGQKWMEYSHNITENSKGAKFDVEEKLSFDDVELGQEYDFIGLTQNETSNGTQLSMEQLKSCRLKFPDRLIGVDATSAMAGVETDYSLADFWYASVQKCFGLPAGMAVIVCSPKAIERAESLDIRGRYNSLPFMIDMIGDFQTTFTPNVINIYMLMRVLKNSEEIGEVDAKLEGRMNNWINFFENIDGIEPLVENSEVRSMTVLPLRAEEEMVERIKAISKEAGLVLGNGYGQWKQSTFRIANFPAMPEKGINLLKDFFVENFT
ncbi:aminotransferase class V-fold PLP-dependent enzyme [Aureibacter tunicatorum]|uniref:phosphoserine transaminase n=1 Tax=Aureibacter tunicatorum TaxID=866807 RepID=A0AAE4BSM7_9BACT|nr:aminotransferase class V-fold PLP-dependent enzyme [Aureibacter tunicatorum]MDR6239020.1 phosphoserine aminotransferase [Aureibacter tunicatorum]